MHTHLLGTHALFSIYTVLEEENLIFTIAPYRKCYWLHLRIVKLTCKAVKNLLKVSELKNGKAKGQA
jgi:hypothetical protein